MPFVSNNALIRKLRLFTALSPQEVEWLEQATANRIALGADSELVWPENVNESVYVLESGWAYRFKALPDGRRQVLNFVLPGDFIGLRAHIFGFADHSIVTLTDAIVSEISASDIVHLFRDYPKLAAAITWSAAREEAMLSEQIVRLGRRNALESMAHLFLELLNRLKAIGMAEESSYYFPVTQQILADTLGLSIVHVNRTLAKLRKRGLVKIEEGRIYLTDTGQLERLAAFDSAPLAGKQTPASTETELRNIEAGQSRRAKRREN